MKGPDAPDLAEDRPEEAPRPGWLRRAARALRIAGLGVLSAVLLVCRRVCAFRNACQRPRDAGESRVAADAIIVLTGGQSRIDAALDLLKSGKGERLLISGVNPVAGREALRAATGADKRLFKCCVDIDNAALDTIGNAEESAKWVEQHAYGRVILVTNNYHMPRSLLEMRRLLVKATLEPYPVVNSRLDGGGWMVKPDALRVIFTEYLKYLAAIARGLVPPSTDESSDLTVVNASATAAR